MKMYEIQCIFRLLKILHEPTVNFRVYAVCWYFLTKTYLVKYFILFFVKIAFCEPSDMAHTVVFFSLLKRSVSVPLLRDGKGPISP